MADTEDLLGDGYYKVTWCLNIANIHAPTAAELNAGVDLQLYITKDGFNVTPDQAAVDNSSLASTGPTERGGSTAFGIELTCKRKKIPAEDVAWNTLQEKQMGFLAVRRTLPEGDAWAAGQEAEIYPAECGKRRKQQTAANEVQKFISKLFNHSPADDNAVVAA
ncbi:hypothetical protein [Microbispora sp. CA-102843]|uniref:phage tail tube protein n=1 Tax=Microbispora sp. CA-102843 TaxID=3239952 RepID=UPI003D9301F8